MAKKQKSIRRKPLTPTQRAFLLAWIARGGNGTEAALDTCGCSTVRAAAVCANRLLRNVDIQLAIEEEMEKRGLGMDRIIQKLAARLDSVSLETNFRALELIIKLRDTLPVFTKEDGSILK